MKRLIYPILLIMLLFILCSCSDNNPTEVTQTAKPVINPAGGTFTSTQNVAITTTTADATIRYTTNGVDPDSTSTIYTAALSVSSNMTIKAKAFKSGQTPSEIATATFTIYNQMSEVTAGTFTMGRTNDTVSGYDDERPTHQVTLAPFYIGKYEVKQSEWVAIMGSNPSSSVGDNKPVEQVSFYQVLVYCNKRSMAEHLDPVYTINGSTNPTAWGTIPTTVSASWDAATMNTNANGYRLPTEAEWEYAARGGVSTPDYLYAGSNTASDVSWYNDNSGGHTQLCGLKAANGLGLYDMSGNVQEWVWDWYGT
ncbi:MAG TPA: SUMF1/EgtB/PvdO family nonheme iron enzyme, partial [Candidatus Cloacimonadota bacterium]|nr:SUMF1/EgtB/PvdO family nonheme iron enzyme [Candidatus Cloacimonadota bacterium]